MDSVTSADRTAFDATGGECLPGSRPVGSCSPGRSAPGASAMIEEVRVGLLICEDIWEPNPARASTVDVRFDAEGDRRTRVTLEHRDFDHHGDGVDDYRAALASEQGWPYILSRYAAAAG